MRIYEFDNKAKECWGLFRKWRNERMRKENNEAIYNLYPKIEANIQRIAGILHIVNAVLIGKEPDKFISLETLERAIYVGKFYLRQSILVYRFNQQNAESQFEGKIIEFARNKSDHGFTARDIRVGIKPLRKQTSNAQEVETFHLLPLIEKGYLAQKEKRFYFKPQNRDRTVTAGSHPLSLEPHGFQADFSEIVTRDRCEKKGTNEKYEYIHLSAFNQIEQNIENGETLKLETQAYQGFAIRSTESNSVNKKENPENGHEVTYNPIALEPQEIQGVTDGSRKVTAVTEAENHFQSEEEKFLKAAQEILGAKIIPPNIFAEPISDALEPIGKVDEKTNLSENTPDPTTLKTCETQQSLFQSRGLLFPIES